MQIAPARPLIGRRREFINLATLMLLRALAGSDAYRARKLVFRAKERALSPRTVATKRPAQARKGVTLWTP